MDPVPTTGRVHCYSRDEMMSIRNVSERSRRRPSELPAEFNNEEGLFSPDAWIEHCWIREGVADRVGAETGKRKPLLGELPSGDHHQTTRKGFFDDVVGASAQSKLRSHKYSANGMDFRPSFQKSSTTPGQSPDVHRPWMRNMDYTSVGTQRHTERHESVPEWVGNGPESITDVIELRGFDDGKEVNARSQRREQKKAPTTPIPLMMPKTDEEFAALLGLTFDDLKLDASTSEMKASSSESTVPAQSRFSKFFATNNTQSTRPSSNDDGAVGGKGAEAPPNSAEKAVTPGAHSLLQKLFGGKLGDVRTEDGSKINSGVAPVRKGVMSAEELERQLMMEAQLKAEDLSSSGTETKQAQIVGSCESEAEASTSHPAGDDASITVEEDLEASPPHAPIPSSHLPAVHPQLMNPLALEAFLQQYFPAQDRLLRMHSVTPFDLYQRRLTFIHIMSRQWPTSIPGGGVPPQAFPLFATPPLPPNPFNPATPNNSIVDHAQQHTTDYYSGQDGSREKAVAPSMLQKLLSQSGSRSESHAGSPLPTTTCTGAPVVGKKMVMSVEELEKSFLESESSTTRTPIETQQRTPSVTSQLPIRTPPTLAVAPSLAQIGPPLMAGFPPPLRMPLFPTHPTNAPAIPAPAQMHAYHHHFLMAQQAQHFQQRQQAAMANAPTTGFSGAPPQQLPLASHLPPTPSTPRQPPVHLLGPHAQLAASGLNNNRTTPSQTSSKRTTPTAQSSTDESAAIRNMKADGTKATPTMNSAAAFMPTSVMRKQASRKQSDGQKNN